MSKSQASVNNSAWQLAKKLCDKPEEYGVIVKETRSGTTLIDAGIEAKGGYLAGKIITEICLGGFGRAEIFAGQYDDIRLPSISVYTDHPAIATLGSQFAGWQIRAGDFFAMGSGPARALALKPKELYEKIEYEDKADRAKTGIHKLTELGFDPKLFSHACGYAPIAPVHPKAAQAMGRTNDAIFYAGIAYYTTSYDDDEKLKELVKKTPSSVSESYGKPFFEIFKEAGYDFYKIDPGLFAPAVLIVNNAKTGSTFGAGKVNIDVLKKSMGL
jgi:methenyltetrahydromethanopterin cyclohydrolase